MNIVCGPHTDPAKEKGPLIEKMADIIGVSHQAVSKWEGEQSISDVDKIILMGEFFGVTTNYILKGIESPKLAYEEVMKLKNLLCFPLYTAEKQSFAC